MAEQRRRMAWVPPVYYPSQSNDNDSAVLFGSLAPTDFGPLVAPFMRGKPITTDPITSATPVSPDETGRGGWWDASQKAKINPVAWRRFIESASPSLNIEDRRNPDDVKAEELWGRIGTRRDRSLSPDERNWLFNYQEGRATTFDDRWAPMGLAPVAAQSRYLAQL